MQAQFLFQFRLIDPVSGHSRYVTATGPDREAALLNAKWQHGPDVVDADTSDDVKEVV